MGRRRLCALSVLLLVAGCSGHQPVAHPPGGALPMRLVAYSDCPGLLSDLRAATARSTGPYGLTGNLLAMQRQETSGAAAAPAQSQAGGATPDHSGTNTHEIGVDEPDLVKTDGRRIVALARGRLHVVDAATRKVTGTLRLPPREWGAARLLLSGERALVITPQQWSGMVEGNGIARPAPYPSGPRLRLTLVELTGKPRVLGTLTADAGYVDARQSGSRVHVVIRTTPRIPFASLRARPPGRSEQEMTARNRQLVRTAPLEAWLPAYAVTSGSTRRQLRVPCERVSHPPEYTGTSLLSVLTVDLADGLRDADPISVVTDGQTVYGTGSSLYVAGARPTATAASIASPIAGTGTEGRDAPVTGSQDVRTDIHRFDVTGAGHPRYQASGSVPGTLLNQYSLSEYQGRLRVATTSGSATGASVSAVRILERQGPRLRVVGGVGGLGKGERVYAVRFVAATGYVVTFRQVDPLYALDLRDPARPKVMGELKITGYSAYLHPAGNGRLLGVGQEASPEGRRLGTQVSLFDVTGRPKRLARHQLPGTATETEFDPHAFLFWPPSGLTVVPISTPYDEGMALALRLSGDGMHRVGIVRHPQAAIRRSLVIGDTLWTMSDAGLRASDIDDLGERAWISF